MLLYSNSTSTKKAYKKYQFTLPIIALLQLDIDQGSKSNESKDDSEV